MSKASESQDYGFFSFSRKLSSPAKRNNSQQKIKSFFFSLFSFRKFVNSMKHYFFDKRFSNRVSNEILALLTFIYIYLYIIKYNLLECYKYFESISENANAYVISAFRGSRPFNFSLIIYFYHYSFCCCRFFSNYYY